MRDPYEVLGVNRNASMDEIKTAYNELVKKYHPDKYHNNPLAGLAEEKMKEINEAYASLSKNHSGGGNGGGYNNSGGYSNNEAATEFQEARQKMNAGDINGAEAILNRSSLRNAEWYYLSGMVSYRKGWYDDAMTKMQTAVNMDPRNFEYRQGLNAMSGTGGAYRNTAYGKGYTQNDDLACKLCQAYICFDCLCDCI